MEFPDPVIEIAVEPKTKGDQEKMGEALARLAKEDPSFRVTSDEESGQTIIDGIVYYDWKRDLKMRKEIQQERIRIITKMIEEKNGGVETQKAFKKKSTVHVCGTLSDDGN